MELVVSIGSNCGNRIANVSDALNKIKEILGTGAVDSGLYETPCAIKTGHSYVNCVVKGEYSGNVRVLDAIFKEMELAAGRNPECREKGEVPLDIDIVMAGSEVLKPWDFNQKFFKKGFLNISQPCDIDKVR